MSIVNKSSIFDFPSQFVEIDPSRLTLLSDRCLIRDLGELEPGTLIARPDSSKGNDAIHIGLVLACGPGDAFIELGLTNEWDGYVRRRLITKPCGYCAGLGKFFDQREYQTVICPRCHGEKREPVVVPPQCKVGDRVLFSRRKECEFYPGDGMVSIVNASQSILAVLEEDDE